MCVRFGNRSKKTKLQRYLQEARTHTRLVASTDTTDMRLSYVPALRGLLNRYLALGVEGVDGLLEALAGYHLTRDDWEHINELAQLKGMEDPLKNVPGKVKSAFTRAYNKVGGWGRWLGSHTHLRARHHCLLRRRWW